MEIEQVKDASGPSEMRAELHRMRNYDPLVRSVMDSADYSGMSAEDRYTLLAYHALRGKNHAQALLLESARMNPPPMKILVDS